MYQIALFDADGVVTSPKMFSVDLEKDFGIKPEVLKPFFHGPFQSCLIGNADLRTVIKPHLAQWGWSGNVDTFLEYWFTSENEVNQKAIELVSDLRKRGTRCYIATNQEAYRARYMRERMHFDALFDGIFSSADLGCKKPSHQFFENLLGRIDPHGDIPREEIVFWDDKTENIEAAREVGIRAYRYVYGEEFVFE